MMHADLFERQEEVRRRGSVLEENLSLLVRAGISDRLDNIVNAEVLIMSKYTRIIDYKH